MVDYKLKFLRTEHPLDSLDAAIRALDNYNYHYRGQPIAVLYNTHTESNVPGTDTPRHVLLALGRRDCESEKINGRDHGPEFYEIINDITEEEFIYHSSYSHDTVIKEFGGIPEGTTLHDLLIQTQGDISRILDVMFFGDAVQLPKIIQPYIEEYSLNGLKDIMLEDPLDVNKLDVALNRGLVSRGIIEGETTVRTDLPFAGQGNYNIHIFDSNGNEVQEPSSKGDYIYRCVAWFEDGNVQPVKSDDSPYESPYDGESKIYTADITVHYVPRLMWLELTDSDDD